MSGKQNRDEAQRLCPTCRMEVSVWATKCHHCGEELGRPRTEETRLTLRDLGGSQQTTYAPSGNVTGALESFRVEETAAEASRLSRKPQSLIDRLLGRKAPLAEAPKTQAPDEVSELSELDEYGKNLAASILDDMPATSRPSTSRGGSSQAASSLRERIIMTGGIFLAIVVIYFVISFTWNRVSAYLEAKNAVPVITYDNKAPEMLARGEDAIDAFEEAVKAARIVDDEANRNVLNDVRSLLLADVDALMSRNPWKNSNYNTAYSYIQRAVNSGNHPALVAKFEAVKADIDAYKFILKSIDGDKATFRLNNGPDFPPEETVEVSDRMMGRFIVQRISSLSVDLLDDKIEGRKLTIGLNEGVKARS